MHSASILWRRVDRPGHDVARLSETNAGWILEGTAVFAEDDQPCRLDYLVVADAAWRTMTVSVTGWLGSRAIVVDISVGVGREWALNGSPCPNVHGCVDIDLSFSPATNLLPIRRMRLDVGQKAPVRAAWLRFPACVLEPLDQIYERVDDRTYRYESADAFTAMLEVNAVGLVTHYPDLWDEEPNSTMGLV
jgi:hypothetical protein